MLEAISTLKNKLVDPEAFKQQADDFFSQDAGEGVRPLSEDSWPNATGSISTTC